jgi:hypothetical protein
MMAPRRDVAGQRREIEIRRTTDDELRLIELWLRPDGEQVRRRCAQTVFPPATDSLLACS